MADAMRHRGLSLRGFRGYMRGWLYRRRLRKVAHLLGFRICFHNAVPRGQAYLASRDLTGDKNVLYAHPDVKKPRMEGIHQGS